MAIVSTGAIYKSLVFDGESSRDYGIYITGQAVYNAPDRDVEMISIPGRSGSFALDKGRFQNIEVTYPAGIFADNEADFAQGISDFRNFLCSRNGYVRLTDEYNPGEYRMAVYKSGLEVEPTQLKAGEFEIIFDCMPQRFLTSGEQAITATSGQAITNPTRFEASPMLEVEGYGNIYINGGLISISNNEIGETPISTRASITKSDTIYSVTLPITIDTSNLNSLDKILIRASASIAFTAKDGYTPDGCYVTQFVQGGSGTTNTTGTAKSIKTFENGFKYGIITEVNPTHVQFDDNWTYNGTAYQNYAYGEISFTYDGANTLQVTLDIDVSACYEDLTIKTLVVPTVLGVSTKSALGNPTYIDLDIGEAWISDGGSPLSVNDNIQMPSELPTLTPGANEVIFDNTITDLKIIPRWWKI